MRLALGEQAAPAFSRAVVDALRALDRLRLASFKAALRSQTLRAVLARRDARLATGLGVQAALAFVLAVYFPVLLFVLGPVLLGVTHVAADVRYLVLRRTLAAWWRRTILAACSALVLLQALALLRVIRIAEGLEFGLVGAWALVGLLGAALKSKAWTRAAIGLVLVLLVETAAFAWPRAFRQGFAHTHNLLALAAWPLFFRRRPATLAALQLPIVGLALVLACGAFYRVSLASPGAHQFGVHVLDLASTLSPFARADLALGVTSAFVFLQAVHYAIWLNVIPQAEQPGEGTLSFRQSGRGLLRDFGALGLGLVVVLVLAVIGAATLSPLRASTSYLSLALFHGYLEVVLLLYFWVEGTRNDRRPSVPGRASS